MFLEKKHTFFSESLSFLLLKTGLIDNSVHISLWLLISGILYIILSVYYYSSKPQKLNRKPNKDLFYMIVYYIMFVFILLYVGQ